jgi:hypothetical protein
MAAAKLAHSIALKIINRMNTIGYTAGKKEFLKIGFTPAQIKEAMVIYGKQGSKNKKLWIPYKRVREIMRGRDAPHLERARQEALRFRQSIQPTGKHAESLRVMAGDRAKRKLAPFRERARIARERALRASQRRDMPTFAERKEYRTAMQPTRGMRNTRLQAQLEGTDRARVARRIGPVRPNEGLSKLELELAREQEIQRILQEARRF